MQFFPLGRAGLWQCNTGVSRHLGLPRRRDPLKIPSPPCPPKAGSSPSPGLCVGQEVGGQAGTPCSQCRGHCPPWLTSVPPSPPGCLTTLRLPKPPLGAGVGLQSPAPAGAAQLTVGAIPNGSQGLRDDRRRRGSPTWQHPLSYLHPGPLQHLDGVLCREVELGFADPARHVVAHGVRAQLVGDLEVQRLLAPSQAAVPCGRAPAPPEKKSPGRYSICCRVS